MVPSTVPALSGRSAVFAATRSVPQEHRHRRHGTVKIADLPGDQDPANYVDLVEYGTSRITPQPFLRPAASLLVAQVPLIARREIAQAVAVEVARMRGGRR